jgi:FKBP-type peptidyl-prolyl cis-trans isomerase FklB
MKKLLAVTALSVLMVSACVLAADAAAPAAAKVPPASTQTRPAATQTQPASSDFKTEMEKISYAIGLNMVPRMKQQMPELNADMLAQGLRDGLTGKMNVDKASYGVGASIGHNMAQQVPDVDADALAQGIKDGLAGKALLNDQEVMQTLMAFSQTMRARQQEKMAKAGQENKEKGEAFLAENAKKEGVKVLPSGLQYKIIKEGNGPKPKATDTVTVKYRGTLIDGTEFDSSHGQTTEFRLSNVIPGWTEGIQLMPVGSEWMLYVPSNLAYGERQAGPQIGPNSTLIFDVDLVGIKGSEQPGAASQPTTAPAK